LRDHPSIGVAIGPDNRIHYRVLESGLDVYGKPGLNKSLNVGALTVSNLAVDGGK
jgi:hypothetical protein